MSNTQTIVDVVHKINNGFNSQNDQPFKELVDNNVVIHRVAKDGQVTQKIGKQQYLEYLHDTWQRLNKPQSENLNLTVQPIGNLVKVLVIYDSTFTPPNQAKRITEPATTVMFFNSDEKLVDATFLTR